VNASNTFARGKSCALKLSGLRKEYGSSVAIDDVSLDIEGGEFLTLLGASGSGKTTTLMAIAGFVSPTRGQVLIDGVDQTVIPTYRRDIGMVFQHYALFPHLNVERNIAFPLQMRRIARSEVADRVGRALDLVRLKGFGSRFPKELSGGQQQRVALARALVYEPSILLLDEPLGALDQNLRVEMQLEIRRIQTVLNITTISVTHDQNEAITMSDRIAVMRAGRIEQIGTPHEIYEQPRTRYVSEFMGSTNFISASVENGRVVTQSGKTCPIPDSARFASDQAVEIAIRPERIIFKRYCTDQEATLPATVETVVYQGSSWRIQVVLDSGEKLISIVPTGDERTSLTVGQRVNVDWEPASAWPIPAYPPSNHM
jgi:putative spermidine/putrescine transport system ATP-binding protein